MSRLCQPQWGPERTRTSHARKNTQGWAVGCAGRLLTWSLQEPPAAAPLGGGTQGTFREHVTQEQASLVSPGETHGVVGAPSLVTVRSQRLVNAQQEGGKGSGSRVGVQTSERGAEGRAKACEIHTLACRDVCACVHTYERGSQGYAAKSRCGYLRKECKWRQEGRRAMQGVARHP